MRRTRFLIATAATMSVAIGAVAQHGHGGMSSGHGMSHQPTTHSTHQPDAKSGTHGERTMDQKLTSNTKLASKLQTLTGMDAQAACSGFKNLGQCVAAAHVSKNLGIKFTDLKDDMLALNPDGTPNTSAKPMSLGKAIQTLKPDADSKDEVKKATQQAKDDSTASS
jgi:hypothetical protein